MPLHNWMRFIFLGVLPFSAVVGVGIAINHYMGSFPVSIYCVAVWGMLWLISHNKKKKELNRITEKVNDETSAILLACKLKLAYSIDKETPLISDLINRLCTKIHEDEIKRRHDVE